MLTWLKHRLYSTREDKSTIQQMEHILAAHKHHNEALPSHLNRQERHIILSIRDETKKHNRNNITRTAAYLDFYRQHPDVHWAFLAHMVSRNGGWSMTDVKGSLLTRILSEKTAQSFFHMFERGNELIFHDAYPQLRLFAESTRLAKPFFHLLPYFGVSRFMVPMWQHYWEQHDIPILTTALIVNEQQYIEQRIIQHPHYRRTVLHTAAFKMQTGFDFNQVVFPSEDSPTPPLIGRTVHRFPNMAHRIKTGRHLYHMLFHPHFYRSIYTWAIHHPHTGSRADYWPKFFTASEKKASQTSQSHSPVLRDVWPNVLHRPSEPGDWYSRLNPLSAITAFSFKEPKQFYITDVYERSYRRLQIAARLAKSRLQ